MRNWKPYLVLFWTILQIGESQSTIDYSQFYLPPCCFPPPLGGPPGLEPLPSNKIEARSLKDPATESNSDSTFEESRNVQIKVEENEERIFKYIVPESSQSTLDPNSSKNEIEKIQAGENANHQKANVKYEEVVLKEPNKIKQNGTNEDSIKFKRYSSFLSNVSQDERSKRIALIKKILKISNKTTRKSTVNDKTYAKVALPLIVTRSKRKLSAEAQPELQNRESSPAKSLPPNWLSYLKKALFQSMMSNNLKDKKRGNDGGGSEILTKSSSNNIQMTFNEKSDPNPQFIDKSASMSGLWGSIQNAKLMGIDPLTKTPSQLPGPVFLPPGVGPIVSGLVVNTEHGIQFRMARELYPPQEVSGDCQCQLINHGDILVAYWTVSRIFNDANSPQLQYLLYPVQHNVPTPPILHPFEDPKHIRPSPIDTFYHPHLLGLNQNELIPLLHLNRNELGLGRADSGFFRAQHHQIPQHPPPQPPPPPPPPQPIQHTQVLGNVINKIVEYPNGFFIHTKQGYTPLILNPALYKAAALENLNHLRRKDAILREKALHIHHHLPPNGNTFNFPENVPQIGRFPHPPQPPLPPQINPNNFQQPPPPPPQDPRFKYPNSIQDIISPGNQIPPPGYNPNSIGIYGHNYGKYIEPGQGQGHARFPGHNVDSRVYKDIKVQTQLQSNNKGPVFNRLDQHQPNYFKDKDFQQRENKNINEPSYILDF